MIPNATGSVASDSVSRKRGNPVVEVNADAGGDLGESESDERRARLRAQREASMDTMKHILEASLDTMREAAERLLAEVSNHVNVTCDVIHDYEYVLESQQKEATRLEQVSKTVNDATNPFLEKILSKMKE